MSRMRAAFEPIATILVILQYVANPELLGCARAALVSISTQAV